MQHARCSYAPVAKPGDYQHMAGGDKAVQRYVDSHGNGGDSPQLPPKQRTQTHSDA